LLVGLCLLAVGIVLSLYGLFAIVYGGDSRGNGNTYVKFGGHKVDADVAGAISLVIGLIVLVVSWRLVRRRRRRGEAYGR
jgi:hypothetical protein